MMGVNIIAGRNFFKYNFSTVKNLNGDVRSTKMIRVAIRKREAVGARLVNNDHICEPA
jgi:hypothetical protein